jgi:hypothetical protein
MAWYTLKTHVLQTGPHSPGTVRDQITFEASDDPTAKTEALGRLQGLAPYTFAILLDEAEEIILTKDNRPRDANQRAKSIVDQVTRDD